MNKYMIVSLIYCKEVSNDMHDLEIKDFEKWSKKAIKQAQKSGINLFFKETSNDRVISNSFATVEHNFDISVEEKQKLVKFLTKFFNDAEIEYDTLNVENTLNAVRFLKVDGDLLFVW